MGTLTRLRILIYRFFGLFFKQQRDSDLQDEIRSHLEMQIEDNLRQGMSAKEARQAALRKFGGVDQVKEQYRTRRGLPFIETTLQDLRYAIRMLLKAPGFTTVAVISLALGIGANTAIFSLTDAVLLRNLPVKEPGKLYQIAHSGDRGIDEGNNFPLFEQIRNHNQSFSEVMAFNPNQWKVTVDGETEIVSGQVVTGNYFSVLGVNPIIGRTLTPDDDDLEKASPVAVISYTYWQHRLSRDPNVLGKTIVIDLVPFTIVGVTPPEFFGLQTGRSSEISVPLSMHSRVGSGGGLGARDFWWNLPIIGRLKPGVTPEQAGAEVDVLTQQFLDAIRMKPERRKASFARAELLPAGKGLGELRKQFSYSLYILTVAVALVLLIACANVAGLLLARSKARRKEIAIRLAIGAGRAKLVRQLITESILLSVLGGTLGLLFAYWFSDFLISLVPQASSPLLLHFVPDARILVFTFGVSVITGVLFGLAPALGTMNIDLSLLLKDNRHGVTDHSRFGPGKALIVFQIALSMMLLVGAGLFARSLQNLQNVKTGFDRDHILLVDINCYGTNYKDEKLTAMHRELLERMNALPGIRSASLSTASPFTGGIDSLKVSLPGIAEQIGGEEIKIAVVAPRYFETMGVQLAAGREIDSRDTQQSPKTAVISESVSRLYFENQSPVGRHINIGGSSKDDEYEIVGIAKDVYLGNLRKEPTRIIYLSSQQSWTRPSLTFVLNSTLDENSLAAQVRSTIQSVGRDIPITSIKKLNARITDSLVQERIVAMLSSFFGIVALLLSCIGLYGVMSYAVSRSTNEIGIRMALGAQRSNVLWMILRQTLALVAIGVVIGLPAAIAFTRLTTSLLYNLSPTDPATLSMVSLLLVCVGIFAGYLPARRATKVDPMIALRCE